MATPLLAALRSQFPAARIDFLTTPAAAALLRNDPNVSNLLTAERRGGRRAFDYAGLVRQLRAARYDMAFAAMPTIGFSQGVRPVLARVPVRVVHAYPFRPADDYTALFTHRVPWDEARHDVESNLDLLRAVADGPVCAGPLVLDVGTRSEAAVRALHEAGWSGNNPLVAFCPGSDPTTAFKRWPLANFAELARDVLAAWPDASIAVIGGPDERQDVRQLVKTIDDPRAFAFTSDSLLLTCAALRECTAAVSADSLPIHLCAALEVPLVALFGPTDPRRTGPWRGRARVVTAPCDFAPYYRLPYPPRAADAKPCMHVIAVRDVFAALNETLRNG